MNVAERLAREIARVTKIREHYAALDGMPGINVKPALFLMDQELEAAKLAAGQDDAIAQMAALEYLAGYDE